MLPQLPLVFISSELSLPSVFYSYYHSILDWIVSIYEINRKHWYHPLVGMTLSHWQASFDLRFTGSRAGQLLTSLRNRANKTPRTRDKRSFFVYYKVGDEDLCYDFD